MSNRPTNKVVYTANQNIIIPLRQVLPKARHYGSIKFTTIEAIFVTTCKQLLNTLTKRVYNKTDTTTPINCAIIILRKELLKKLKHLNTERLPLTIAYNRTLPDLKTIIDKNWHVLQIEPKLKEIFAEPPILAFKRNKNLRDIIGGNKVYDTKKILNVKKLNKEK